MAGYLVVIGGATVLVGKGCGRVGTDHASFYHVGVMSAEADAYGYAQFTCFVVGGCAGGCITCRPDV